MTEMSYNPSELPKLKYVKISYANKDGDICEVITKVRRIDDELVSVYVKSRKDFFVDCPQKITIKFVADDCAYVSIATLQKVGRVDDIVYFTVEPPQTIYKQQNRKYYRISLQRGCVLVATDKNGQNNVFMSRVVDVSGGGVLIHNLESMFDSKFVPIEPDNYEFFNIILFLDLEIVLKLHARFVRQEVFNNSYRYAFEFIKMKQVDTDTICQYVAKKQVEQLQIKNK